MFRIIKKRTRSCYSRTDDRSREFLPNRSEHRYPLKENEIT